MIDNHFRNFGNLFWVIPIPLLFDHFPLFLSPRFGRKDVVVFEQLVDLGVGNRNVFDLLEQFDKVGQVAVLIFGAI